jgi:hypothetical protein
MRHIVNLTMSAINPDFYWTGGLMDPAWEKTESPMSLLENEA